MKVKELFQKVNKEDMFLSFIRRYDIIESYDHRASVAQEVEIYKYFKDKLFGFADRITSYEDNTTKDILFVIDVPACDFEDKQKRVFEVFLLDKKEYLEKCVKDFTLWSGTENIKRYALFGLDLENIANIEVANKSIEEYGVEAVCAAISHELQTFEFYENKKAKKAFFDGLTKTIKENEEENYKNCKSADEVFKELKKEFAKNLTEDEKKYFEEQDKFENNISKIKEKWIFEEFKRKEKIMIDFIKINK